MATVDEILRRKDHRFSAFTKSVTTKQLSREVAKSLDNKFTPPQISNIIRVINDLIYEELLFNSSFKFPYGLGTLELAKYNTVVKMKDGKVWTNRPTDWKRTLEYWSEDEEARKNRKKIYLDTKSLFKVKYRKTNVTFKNYWFTTFKLLRRRKLQLKELVEQNKIDSFLGD